MANQVILLGAREFAFPVTRTSESDGQFVKVRPAENRRTRPDFRKHFAYSVGITQKLRRTDQVYDYQADFDHTGTGRDSRFRA